MNIINLKNKDSFTLIELIITIVIAGIIITLIAGSYRQLTEAIIRSSDLSKAVNLSELEFSIVNSLPYNHSTLSNGYDNLTLNYQNSGYNLRRQVVYVEGNDLTTNSIKRINVLIYRPNVPTPILAVSTLRTKNVTYGP